MQHIYDNIEKLNNMVVGAKATLEKLYNDKSIPLEVRWDIFQKAPEYLKNSEWAVHSGLEDILGEHSVGYDGSILDCERHQTIYTYDLIMYFEERKLEELDSEELTPEHIETLNKLKEHILSTNLGSFVYDW